MKSESIFPTGIAVGGGLNKKEYSAVKILQGMLSGAFSNQAMLNDFLTVKSHRKAFAKAALNYAEELLDALEKPTKDE
jgi:hypothetical protein